MQANLKTTGCIFFLLYILTAFFIRAHATAPGIAGTLSVVPGLGQVSNGEPLEGLGWFAVVAGGFFASANSTHMQTVFLDLWMYNIYDAYRDAGAKRSARYNVFQNYIAAFDPRRVVAFPAVVPMIAQGAAAASSSSSPSLQLGPDNKLLTPFAMGFIALGEEGLFRGVFFPGFSDLFGSVAVGAVTSSLLFAAAHSIYDGQRTSAFEPGVFLWRTFLGIIYSIQTHRDQYDLRNSIFSHTWVDVIHEYDRQGVIAGGSTRSVSSSGRPTGLRLMMRFPI